MQNKISIVAKKGVLFLFALLLPGFVIATESETLEVNIQDEGGNIYEMCSNIWMNNDQGIFNVRDHWIALTDTIQWPENDTVALTIHEVNKENSVHLAYSFFVIADPGVGDVWTDHGGESLLWDYNCTGYSPDFNENCPVGSSKYAHAHFRNVIDMVKWYYEGKYSDGVEAEEAIFCILDGDIAQSAERAEFQYASQMMDVLPMPWLPVVGNHDTWPWA
ncbi:hypothetical protein GF338_09260 [candidate division WOR-3 bacterium]|nr:hypothetical protein [candidate division WOR-3 bacterium]